MRYTIKICGLTREADVETAIKCGANYLGFIVECASPRRLNIKQASALLRPAKGIANTVAVTVNPSLDLLRAITNQMQPDYIQLHGHESPEQVAKIKSATGLGIIKAVLVRNRTDLKQARDFAGIADYILLDAKPPINTNQQGGHGLAFDWHVLDNFNCKTPLILAGGLNPFNIKQAKKTGLNFFDVSSGVEASAGVKDPSLIAEFMKVVHE